MSYRGIDISNNNGCTNLAKVKQSGIQIVYMKASEGLHFQDGYLQSNYKNAKANGLKVGFYHFLHIDSDPISQAKHFLNCIKGLKNDCIHACDVEITNGKLPAEVSNAVKLFCDYVQKETKQKVVVYTYSSFCQESLLSYLNVYSLWVANYSGTNNPAIGNWKSYVGYQYSQNGNISGVNGNCDLDFFNNGIFVQGIVKKVVTKATNVVKKVIAKVNPKKPIMQLRTDIILKESTIPDENVKQLQKALNLILKPTTENKIMENGLFSKEFGDIVVKYQSSRKLVADKIVGSKTLTQINKDLAKLK